MDSKPKIVIIHSNSLCCLAMRTILTDIAPFMGMFGEVDITTHNSMEEFMSEAPLHAIMYFVEDMIVLENIDFFSSQARRCILLSDQEHAQLANFRKVDVRQPERELLKCFLTIHSSAHSAHIGAQQPKKEAELLSEREKEVLALIVKGFINKEIADKLNISTPTVIFHRKNIVEKIGSKSIGRLTIYAVINGIVDVKEL